MPKQRAFILPPHRQRPAAPTPPSPFRLRVVPGAGTPRTLDCPRRFQELPGVKRYAASFAADCGLSGRVEVLELVDGEWKPTHVLDVKNSAPAGWRDVAAPAT